MINLYHSIFSQTQRTSVSLTGIDLKFLVHSDHRATTQIDVCFLSFYYSYTIIFLSIKETKLVFSQQENKVELPMSDDVFQRINSIPLDCEKGDIVFTEVKKKKKKKVKQGITHFLEKKFKILNLKKKSFTINPLFI